MNGISRALLSMAVLSLPALSSAQQQATRPTESQFSYSYVEIGYDEIDYEVSGAGDIDGDGLTLSGSYELTDDWHVFASYGTFDLDFGIDLDTWVIGAGYVYPIRNDVDIYGRVLYIDSSVDVGPFSDDDDGLGVQGRIRYRVSDEFEVEGGLQYIDVADSDTSLQASARYYFTDDFSVGLGVTFGGDSDGIGINARLAF
jgi:outer membrane protein with beta-barrel domain